MCSDALDTAFEICKLVKFSPNRNSAFDRIKAENDDSDDSPIGIRKLCPTRWTVRGDSISSIIENYTILKLLWDECLKKKLEPDIKGRIIGVKSLKTQMAKYNLHAVWPPAM